MVNNKQTNKQQQNPIQHHQKETNKTHKKPLLSSGTNLLPVPYGSTSGGKPEDSSYL